MLVSNPLEPCASAYVSSAGLPTLVRYPLASVVRAVRWPNGAMMAVGAPPPARLMVVTLPSPSVIDASRPSSS